MPVRATLAVTAGDPCGIGPEVVLKALVVRRRGARLVVIGDLPVFERTARRLRLRLPAWRVVRSPLECGSGALLFLDRSSTARFQPGTTSRDAGAAALDYLQQALRLWQRGLIGGLVTAPVTKWAVAQARPGFIGHTEFLAQAMRTGDVVMAFVSDHLRVALMTRHIPLGSVPRRVTPSLVRMTVAVTANALKSQFGLPRPRLAVCGINPHAGEQGRCGQEDQRVVQPAVAALRRAGIDCDGPLAADGLFADPGRYDAVICAYHDQGLIPFKMSARDSGCQVTLGLPIVRTSPDHGSALDIAGRGIAHPGSMRYALRLAESLASRRSRRSSGAC